jgi:hypothetical protein
VAILERVLAAETHRARLAPVTSWRDSASQQAQDALDELFSAAIETAQGLLGKNGEFFPFGVEVRDDNDVALFGADPGLGEHPPSTEVLRALAAGARSERDKLQAVALACDVTLATGSDAVRVELEHREGVVLEIIVPYRRRRLGRRVTLGQMAVSEGHPQIWGDLTH